MFEWSVHQIGFLIVLGMFVAHRGYYSRKFPPQTNETLVSMGFHTLTIASTTLSIAALMASTVFIVYPVAISSSGMLLPTWLSGFGYGVAAAGFALLEWSHRVLRKNWSDQPRMTTDQKLICTGPYRWIRHPIYLAFFLILGSTLLITANWLVGFLWVTAVGLECLARIRFEEAALLDRFGDRYVQYRETTGSLLPRLWRF